MWELLAFLFVSFLSTLLFLLVFSLRFCSLLFRSWKITKSTCWDGGLRTELLSSEQNQNQNQNKKTSPFPPFSEKFIYFTTGRGAQNSKIPPYLPLIIIVTSNFT